MDHDDLHTGRAGADQRTWQYVANLSQAKRRCVEDNPRNVELRRSRASAGATAQIDGHVGNGNRPSFRLTRLGAVAPGVCAIMPPRRAAQAARWADTVR